MSIRKRRPSLKVKKGGSVKFSDVSSGISIAATALSATPLAPFAAPVALISGLASGIAKLFGGKLSKSQMKRMDSMIRRGRAHHGDSMFRKEFGKRFTAIEMDKFHRLLKTDHLQIR